MTYIHFSCSIVHLWLGLTVMACRCFSLINCVDTPPIPRFCPSSSPSDWYIHLSWIRPDRAESSERKDWNPRGNATWINKMAPNATTNSGWDPPWSTQFSSLIMYQKSLPFPCVFFDLLQFLVCSLWWRHDNQTFHDRLWTAHELLWWCC